MDRGRVRVVAMALAAVGLGAPIGAHGQGFGFYEQSACAMGRGGAGVAAPCADGSAVFFNPAGLSFRPGLEVTVGGTLLGPDTEFAADVTGTVTEGEDDTVSVPHAYVRYGIDDRLAVAFGAYAPYGLVTEWPDDFEGAFVGYDNELRTVYLQPTVAFRIHERVSIGGGPVVVVSSVELNQRLDLSLTRVPQGFPSAGGETFGDLGIPPGTPFAEARFEKDGATGHAVHLGIAVEVTDRIRAGVRWLSSATIEYDDGEAEFESVPTGFTIPVDNRLGVPGGGSLDAVLAQVGLFESGGPFADGTASTEIEMPDQVVVGVAVEATDRLTVLADWQWTNWSTFDVVRLDFENPATPGRALIQQFDDTNGVRLGAEYGFEAGWTLRGGYVHNEEASPPQSVTPILFEGSRDQVTLGATVPLAGRVTLDVGYIHLGQDDRRGRVRGPRPGEEPTVELDGGVFRLDANLFGADVRIRL